jgi:hypothetical protein
MKHQNSRQLLLSVSPEVGSRAIISTNREKRETVKLDMLLQITADYYSTRRRQTYILATKI